MRIDRYLAVVLTIIAIALVAIAVNPWLSSLAPRSAEAQAAQYEHTLPKAWGKLVGFSNGNLLLQAEDGSLREVDVREKSPKVKVQVRWN